MYLDENELRLFAAELLKIDVSLVNLSADINNISNILFAKNDQNEMVAQIECESILVKCDDKAYKLEVSGTFPVSPKQALEILKDVIEEKNAE